MTTDIHRLDATLLFRVDAVHDGKYHMSLTGGPHGDRQIVGVTSGTVSGPRINGTMVNGLASDWVTIRPDGVWEIDVRAGFVTDDGATVLYFYTGVCKPGHDGIASLRGAPRFQTGDPRYTWLNELQAVAIGQADLRRHVATYDVYSLD